MSFIGIKNLIFSLLSTVLLSAILIGPTKVAAATSEAALSISPATQSVAAGSDTTFSVNIDPNGTSVQTVQSVITYNSSIFNLVSITAGNNFSAFPHQTSSGSITFAAGSETPITANQLIATITLKAISSGTSSVNFSSICPPNDYGSTCSAAWDSSTSNNDLGTVSGANFNVTGSTQSNNNGSGAVPAITLSVVSNSNTPVDGALVTLNGVTLSTGANGQVAFHDVKTGMQNVVVKSGSESSNHNITVNASSNTQPQHFILAAQSTNTSSRDAEIIVLLLILALVVYLGIAKAHKESLF